MQLNYLSNLLFKLHSKFFGSLIYRGRKNWALNFFFNLKFILKRHDNSDPNVLFLFSMLQVIPPIFLRIKKIAQVYNSMPLPINEKKQITLAIKWFIKLLRDKNRVITINDLVDLIVSAAYRKGTSVNKSIDFQITAIRNRYLLKYLR